MRRPRSIKMVTASCYHKGSYHEVKNTLNARCSVFVNAYGKKVCRRRGGGRVFHRSSSGNPAHVPNAGFMAQRREHRYFHRFFGGWFIRALLDTEPHASRMMVCTGIRSNADQRRRARALEPGASCRVPADGHRPLSPGGGSWARWNRSRKEVVNICIIPR